MNWGCVEMEGLYTIAEIARRLRLPESTIRYYRDRFPEYVPSIGEGRNRRYPQEALDALRAIADAMRSGIPEDIVRDMLRSRFAMTVVPQQYEATPQQQDAAFRQWIEDAVRRAVAEALEERDRKLIQALEERQKALDEALAAIREQATAKRKWRWWWRK